METRSRLLVARGQGQQLRVFFQGDENVLMAVIVAKPYKYTQRQQHMLNGSTVW